MYILHMIFYDTNIFWKSRESSAGCFHVKTINFRHDILEEIIPTRLGRVK